MAERVKARYLGPDAIKILRLSSGECAGEVLTFIRGTWLLDVPDYIVPELKAMNERGCTLETAGAYEQHLFEFGGKGGEG